jgi:DNA repair protein RadA/Sms
VPAANAPKKGRVGDMEVIGVERLSQAIDACRE